MCMEAKGNAEVPMVFAREALLATFGILLAAACLLLKAPRGASVALAVGAAAALSLAREPRR